MDLVERNPGGYDQRVSALIIGTIRTEVQFSQMVPLHPGCRVRLPFGY